MTAIIAVLDNKWVHIWTDSMVWTNWTKSFDFEKVIYIWDMIIAFAWNTDYIDIVKNFYSNRESNDMNDETLLELKDYMSRYMSDDYWIIFSDWNIIKLIDKSWYIKRNNYVYCWSWWLQALSAYLALSNTQDYEYDINSKNHIINSIKVAIDMDESCWWEAKYYFLKKPDGQ